MNNRHGGLLDRTEWVVAEVLTALVAGLHVVRMFYAGPLWRDEIHGLSIASAPSVSSLWGLLSKDHLPLGFPLALHAWIGAGGGASDLGLRAFGALAGIGVVGALWWTAAVFRQRIPLVSLVLLGLSPVIIIWGDAIRHYGISASFMLFTLGMVWRMTQRPTTLNFWLAAGVATLSVQCALFNAFFLVAVCLGSVTVFLRRGQGQRALLPLALGAIVALTVLPYLPRMIALREAAVSMRYPITAELLLPVFIRALGSPILFLVVLWLGLFTAVAAATAWTLLLKKEGSQPSFDKAEMRAFLLTTMLAGLAAYSVWIGLASFRPFLWHFVPVLVLVAACLDRLVSSFIVTDFSRWCRLAAVVLLAAVLVPACYRQIQVRQTSIDLVAAKAEELARAADLILVNPYYLGIGFNRYYHGPAPWTTVPPLDDDGFQGDVRKYMTREKSLQPLLDLVSDTLRTGNRVWLVGNYPFSPTPQPQPELASAIETGLWWEGTYQRAWAAQVAYLVQSRAGKVWGVQVNRPGPVNEHEDVSFAVVGGWKQ